MSAEKETEIGSNQPRVPSIEQDSPKTLATIGSDLDDNYALYQQQGGEQLDPEEAKKVLKKVDLRILPILIVIYLLQYLDKNGINYASAYGLEEGTGLEGQVCSTLCLLNAS
jgi:hypothetical protein